MTVKNSTHNFLHKPEENFRYHIQKSVITKICRNPLPALKIKHLKMSSAACKCLCQALFWHTDKHCGPRSDCSSRSSLIWVHTVCYRDVLNGPADDTADDIKSQITAEELTLFAFLFIFTFQSYPDCFWIWWWGVWVKKDNSYSCKSAYTLRIKMTTHYYPNMKVHYF